jgi:hypothetical protein
MTQLKKVLIRILHGTSDTNIAFTDLQKLLIEIGFEERVRVKQVRAMILKYHLGGSDDD